MIQDWNDEECGQWQMTTEFDELDHRYVRKDVKSYVRKNVTRYVRNHVETYVRKNAERS